MHDLTTYLQKHRATILGWYEELHAMPEASYEEFRTTERIVDLLNTFPGVTLHRPTPTGVIAELDTGRPGPTIALRADIDALVMPEHNDIPFRSQHEGHMHACGHDAHTAMLLGTVCYLSEMRDQLSGRFRFLFQPAEEIAPGGALPFIEAGALDGVDAVLGQHVMPQLPTGTFGLLDGAIMSSVNTLYCTIHGKGGHASMPHLNVDVITAGAHIVQALQLLVSREVSALDQAVVSITNFHAGTAHNVMAQEAQLIGTIRTFRPEVRAYLAERIPQVIEGIAHSLRCTADIDYREGYPATINHTPVVNVLRRTFTEHFGAEALPLIEPCMGGEDFSRYLERIPGAFYFLGIGNEEKGFTHPLHHSCFRVDPDAIPLGVEALVCGALSLQEEVRTWNQ